MSWNLDLFFGRGIEVKIKEESGEKFLGFEVGIIWFYGVSNNIGFRVIGDC